MRLTYVPFTSTLLCSVIAGVEILATDGYLWAAAPSHAVGLLVFAATTLFLSLGVLILPQRYSEYARYGFIGAVLLSTA